MLHPVQGRISEMRSTAGLLLSASALLGASCVNGLAEEVFAAIDKQDDGLKAVNKEVRVPQ